MPNHNLIHTHAHTHAHTRESCTFRFRRKEPRSLTRAQHRNAIRVAHTLLCCPCSSLVFPTLPCLVRRTFLALRENQGPVSWADSSEGCARHDAQSATHPTHRKSHRQREFTSVFLFSICYLSGVSQHHLHALQHKQQKVCFFQWCMKECTQHLSAANSAHSHRK
jgi:hypothetical protein